MALPLTPLTELDAVNAMLELVGETPVNSLDESGISEASIARGILHRNNLEVQSWGLHCNVETEYPIPQDIDGFIRTSPNMLQVDASDASLDVTVRGNKLYNKADHTFIWSNPVNCDIIWFLPFEDLPQTARMYITVRAMRQFQVRNLGAVDLHKLTEKDELEAVAAFRRSELRNKDATLLDSVPVQRVSRRSFI